MPGTIRRTNYTALSVGRDAGTSLPGRDAAHGRSTGLRIGVVREYMNRKLLAKADEESIDLVERAIAALRQLGATVVDPGPEGALFQRCIARSAPELLSAAFTRQYRQLFPVDAAGQPQGDQIATLVELHADPARVPEALTLRSLGGGFGEPGEDKYMINRYLRERGDANIKTQRGPDREGDVSTRIRTSRIGRPRASRPSARPRSTPRRGCTHGSRCRRC